MWLQELLINIYIFQYVNDFIYWSMHVFPSYYCKGNFIVSLCYVNKTEKIKNKTLDLVQIFKKRKIKSFYYEKNKKYKYIYLIILNETHENIILPLNFYFFDYHCREQNDYYNVVIDVTINLDSQ